MSRVLNEEIVDMPPRDAASVIVLRDGPSSQMRVFMLKRGRSTTVVGQAYVFPGGKIDAEDAQPKQAVRDRLPSDMAQAIGEPGLSDADATALYVAACRETFEECAVHLHGSDLVPLSRWITPKVPAMMRKRFDTRFFAAHIPEGAVAVHDGEEATDSAWFAPREALQAYFDGQINLAPPQIMTLAGLARFSHFAELKADLLSRVPPLVQPFPFKGVNGERMMAYPGHEKHPVNQRAIPGPGCLIWRNDRFEPLAGFDGFFHDD